MTKIISFSIRFITVCAIILPSISGKYAWAEEELKPVLVEADQEKVARSAEPLPEVKETKIYSGKKTTVVESESKPEVTMNNYRQLFSEIPGLLVSDVSNESFASINYRGLGDPHESFNLLFLKDGIPIQPDPFGYPAAYYQPPTDTIERIEFTRGGGALLFGPQPGGVINYETRKPVAGSSDSFRTKQVVGSKNLYSTYNEISGSKDELSYLAFFHSRQSDGFRVANSDFIVNNGGFKLSTQLCDETSLLFGLDLYSGDHGEAGGLTLERGEGLANYQDDRNQTTLRYDRLRVERYMPTLTLVSKLDSNTTLSARAWAGHLSRFSRRQDTGGATAFGGTPLGITNTIQRQSFTNLGADLRLLEDYQLMGEENTFTIGSTFSAIDAPFRQSKGDTPWANSGELRKDIDRSTLYGSLFAENLFRFGDLKITPSARMEMIGQDIDERLNAGSTVPLRSTDSTNVVPLFGIGASYALYSDAELYGNISQAYKPVAFQDAVPLGTGDTISGDIDEAKTLAYEVGVRGRPVSWARFDLSGFAYDFDNLFGRVGSAFSNTGRAVYRGLDLAGELSLFEIADRAIGGKEFSALGDLGLYSNISLLNAKFVEGPLNTKTPQFAPDYLLRFGLKYSYLEQLKLAFLGTHLASHYADDGNSANRFIPSYKVWDLTGEVMIYEQFAGIVFGINNIFDEQYYARIRSNGIDPAAPRNYYAGINLRF
jgi:Fe(3+) dicitrate transport protein